MSGNAAFRFLLGISLVGALPVASAVGEQVSAGTVPTTKVHVEECKPDGTACQPMPRSDIQLRVDRQIVLDPQTKRDWHTDDAGEFQIQRKLLPAKPNQKIQAWATRHDNSIRPLTLNQTISFKLYRLPQLVVKSCTSVGDPNTCTTSPDGTPVVITINGQTAEQPVMVKGGTVEVKLMRNAKVKAAVGQQVSAEVIISNLNDPPELHIPLHNPALGGESQSQSSTSENPTETAAQKKAAEVKPADVAAAPNKTSTENLSQKDFLVDLRPDQSQWLWIATAGLLGIALISQILRIFSHRAQPVPALPSSARLDSALDSLRQSALACRSEADRAAKDARQAKDALRDAQQAPVPQPIPIRPGPPSYDEPAIFQTPRSTKRAPLTAVEAYNRVRDSAVGEQSVAKSEFTENFRPIEMSLNNLNDVMADSLVRPMFKPSSRGNFLLVEDNQRAQLFPAFTENLAGDIIQNAFEYRGTSNLRLTNPATLFARGDLYELAKKGRIESAT